MVFATLIVLSTCVTVIGVVGTICAAVVTKNRDDNKLETEKLNVQFLIDQARLEHRQEEEHQLKERLRVVIWKLTARDRRQLLLGDGKDIVEVRENLTKMLSEMEKNA